LTLKTGSTVGSYEIVALLGAGGMGEVYRAHDPKLDRLVALKILSPDLASSAEHLRRFEQEARAASALNHPNIISIYDVGRSDGMAFIAMELIDGRDLRGMSAEGPLPFKQILRIACKVADGLAAAHERGIVHRDLKPENIMVSSEGFVKILDFGLAKLIRPWGADEPTVPHTMPGAIFGTAGYMSPEQASGKATDFRSDQFSLAVILYELIACHRPFERPTPPETMTAIIREDPAPLSTVVESIPLELERIVLRCLEKEPRERYGSTRDLARDLREVRDALTDSAGSGRRSTPPHPAATSRRSVWASVVLAVLILAGVSYVAWQNYHSPIGDRTVKSLAVLPFRDLSGTADGQLFADGIAETISSRLTQSSAMRISPVLDGSARGTPQEIAQQHDADLLLRASVQRAADRVRVNWTLVDPISGSDIAGDTVTGSTADVFALEDLVADRVLQTLRVPRGAEARSGSPGITGAADQTSYLEAVGLLLRSKDEKSIDLAISKLRAILVNARDSALVNGTLARALMNKYQMSQRRPFLDEAALYAGRAVQLDGKVAEAHVALGNVRRVTGHLDEAMQSFNSALALQPRSADAYLGLASTLEGMGRAADAEQAFKRTIELRPDWANAYNRYGGFCFQHGRYERAAELYRRFIALQPDLARGYSNLGAALQSMGRYDEALAIHEKALRIEPNATSYSNVGTIRFFLGRYADAAAAFEKAAQLSPNDYVMWANLGDAYRWAPARRSEAAVAYEKSIAGARARLAVNPRDAAAHADIAGCLAKRGELGPAATEIRTALEIDPTNANVLYAAALTAQLRGDSEGSILWLGRAIEGGYPVTDLTRDPELASLRSRADFVRLLSRPKQ
jgi:eukaryotic-like serine/threonine-protein kinase